MADDPAGVIHAVSTPSVSVTKRRSPSETTMWRLSGDQLASSISERGGPGRGILRGVPPAAFISHKSGGYRLSWLEEKAISAPLGDQLGKRLSPVATSVLTESVARSKR